MLLHMLPKRGHDFPSDRIVLVVDIAVVQGSFQMFSFRVTTATRTRE
jgi:hypothetical protein